MNTQPHLLIEKTWEDDQMIELRFQASSERFSGEVEVYATYEELQRVARLITGFPQSHPSSYEFRFSAARGSNRVILKFQTADTRGHCWALISLVEKERSEESVHVALRVEPAAIDNFAQQIADVTSRRGTSAVLPATSGIGMMPPSAV